MLVQEPTVTYLGWFVVLLLDDSSVRALRLARFLVCVWKPGVRAVGSNSLVRFGVAAGAT